MGGAVREMKGCGGDAGGGAGFDQARGIRTEKTLDRGLRGGLERALRGREGGERE